MPREIVFNVAAGTVLVLSGPGGVALRLEGIQAFGGVVLATSELLWAMEPAAGWRVPWGRYEVGGVELELDADDFFAYLAEFAAGHPDADLTHTAQPETPGYGAPNGWITNDDFFYFLSLFP